MVSTYPSEKYFVVSIIYRLYLKLVGGFNLPLWKKWVRQLGWWNSQLNGKIKTMFQTTNQFSIFFEVTYNLMKVFKVFFICNLFTCAGDVAVTRLGGFRQVPSRHKALKSHGRKSWVIRDPPYDLRKPPYLCLRSTVSERVRWPHFPLTYFRLGSWVPTSKSRDVDLELGEFYGWMRDITN